VFFPFILSEILSHFTSVYPPKIKSFLVLKTVKVGALPSHLEWKASGVSPSCDAIYKSFNFKSLFLESKIPDLIKFNCLSLVINLLV